MHIEITPESLLVQLNLAVNPQSLKEMERLLQNTTGWEHFFKHLFSLRDTLAPMDAFIAPSNTLPKLKIKYHGSAKAERLVAFHEAVGHWAQKYRVIVEKLPNKETYYILGAQ